MYNTIILIAALLDGYLWLAVIDKVWSRLSERSKMKTDRRREKYRVPAYQAMECRWAKHENREQLWQEVNRKCR
jgi:hypothetical protein